MAWNGYGWWWWWLAFLVIFFLVPVVYGWGFRGWGPWYRRRPRVGTARERVALEKEALDQEPLDRETLRGREEEQLDGWGWIGLLVWVALIIAIIWIVGVFLWH